MFKNKGYTDITALLIGFLSSFMAPVIQTIVNDPNLTENNTYYQQDVQELEDLALIEQSIDEQINAFDKHSDLVDNYNFNEDLNYKIATRDIKRQKNISNMNTVLVIIKSTEEILDYSDTSTNTGLQFGAKQVNFEELMNKFRMPILEVENNFSYYIAIPTINKKLFALFTCSEKNPGEIISSFKNTDTENDIKTKSKIICDGSPNGSKEIDGYEVFEVSE